MHVENKDKVLNNLKLMIDRRIYDATKVGEAQEYEILKSAVRCIEELIWLNEGYIEDLKAVYTKFLELKLAEFDEKMQPISWKERE